RRVALATADASFRVFSQVLRGSAAVENGAVRDHVDADEPDGADDHLGFGELRRSITRSLDLYLELAERFFDASTRSLEATLRARGVSVTGEGNPAPWTPLRFQGEAGRRTTTTIWLHNVTDQTLEGVRFRSTDLVAHDGAVVPAGASAVDPPVVERVAAGSSVAAALTVDVAPSVPSGCYVGYVLLSAVPDAVLPLSLTVRPPRPDT